MKKIYLSIILLMAAMETYACSLARQEMLPPVSPSEMARSVVPLSPIELTYSIQRGTDKDSTSCSDLGFVTIYVKPHEASQLKARGFVDTGYQFELVSSDSKEPDYTGFTTDPILPQDVENGYLVYYFAWIDGADKYQEPIKLVLNVYTVKSGLRSLPCKIEIEHSGGRTANKSSKGTQQSCAPS